MGKVRTLDERLKDLSRKKEILEAQKAAKEAAAKVRELRKKK